MSYTYETDKTSPNKTRANRTKKDIDFIVIHWWDLPSKKPTFNGTASWLINERSGVSAHYLVEAERVACLVAPKDIAWHAGVFKVNQRSIGLELNPRASEGDYETAAELIYELRQVYGNLPLRPHSSFVGTACPGDYDLKKLDRMARNQGTKPKPPKPSTPSKPSKPVEVKPPTTNGVYPKVNLQVTDSHTATSHNAWVYLMRYGANRKDKSLTVNIQRWLRDLGYYPAKWVDGVFGPDTIRALQRFLRDRGFYTGVIDGIRGPMTIHGEIDYLNSQRKYFI